MKKSNLLIFVILIIIGVIFVLKAFDKVNLHFYLLIIATLFLAGAFYKLLDEKDNPFKYNTNIFFFIGIFALVLYFTNFQWLLTIGISIILTAIFSLIKIKALN